MNGVRHGLVGLWWNGAMKCARWALFLQRSEAPTKTICTRTFKDAPQLGNGVGHSDNLVVGTCWSLLPHLPCVLGGKGVLYLCMACAYRINCP
jgi:hypothetical protein